MRALLALIPLLVEKDDSEVQWHAKNGLAFTVAFVVLFIALTIVGMLPVAGCLTLIATPFAGLAWLIGGLDFLVMIFVVLCLAASTVAPWMVLYPSHWVLPIAPAVDSFSTSRASSLVAAVVTISP